VLALFDHEEVGSMSDRGAFSDLLNTVLERIVLGRGGGREEFLQLQAENVAGHKDELVVERRVPATGRVKQVDAASRAEVDVTDDEIIGAAVELAQRRTGPAPGIQTPSCAAWWLRPAWIHRASSTAIATEPPRGRSASSPSRPRGFQCPPNPLTLYLGIGCRLMGL